MKNITGYYWTKTDDKDNDARVVDLNGNPNHTSPYSRNGGVRPVLPFSLIKNFCSNIVRKSNGILEVEYGEYPRSASNRNLQNELERLYRSKNLRKIKKIYTTDSIKDEDYNLPFEYEYNGKKYIRVKANSYFDEFTLSNGENYKNGDYVWIEVEPIKWIVDEKEDIVITKELVFAGVQFNNKRNYKGDFESTNLYWFLNKIWIKDIIPSKVNKLSDIEEIIKKDYLEYIKAEKNFKKQIKNV